MVIGIGEVRHHAGSGTDSYQGVLGNRGGCGYHFSEKLHAVLVGTANANALRGSVFEHGDNPWRRRRGDRESEGNQIFFILGIVGAILAPLVAVMIQFAVSRQREYLADSSGALLTRYPEGLASALEKISRNPKPMTHANSATSPLYISNPLKGRSFAGLFDTHPPIEERVKRLRQMEDKE